MNILIAATLIVDVDRSPHETLDAHAFALRGLRRIGRRTIEIDRLLVGSADQNENLHSPPTLEVLA